MNWLHLLSCLAQELVKGLVSETLPSSAQTKSSGRKILEYSGGNHSPSHPPCKSVQLASYSKIPKKTNHCLLEFTDFIPTTTRLEHDQGKKREFHLTVSLIGRTLFGGGWEQRTCQTSLDLETKHTPTSSR